MKITDGFGVMESVINSISAYEGAGTAGFITDFLGNRTRITHIPHLTECDGQVEGYPIPTNFFASATEWTGVIRAVQEAKGSLVVVELGAGWAPWLVTASSIARRMQIAESNIHLVGVEGEGLRVESMRTHFVDNNIDPDAHVLLHGIVADFKGWACFTVSKGEVPFGGVPRFPFRNWEGTRSAIAYIIRKLLRLRQTVEWVRCYTLNDLLSPHESIDLIHFDIQGGEYHVIRSAIQCLNNKVRWIVVGTHSQLIETQLSELLLAHGWKSWENVPCVLGEDGNIFIDGCQVWRNQHKF